MPSGIVFVQARSAVDLQWMAFVVDSKEPLSSDDDHSRQKDVASIRQEPDDVFYLRCHDTTLRFPDVADATASEDPCRCGMKSIVRIEIKKMMCVS